MTRYSRMMKRDGPDAGIEDDGGRGGFGAEDDPLRLLLRAKEAESCEGYGVTLVSLDMLARRVNRSAD